MLDSPTQDRPDDGAIANPVIGPDVAGEILSLHRDTIRRYCRPEGPEAPRIANTWLTGGRSGHLRMFLADVLAFADSNGIPVNEDAVRRAREPK